MIYLFIQSEYERCNFWCFFQINSKSQSCSAVRCLPYCTAECSLALHKQTMEEIAPSTLAAKIASSALIHDGVGIV